MSRRDLSIVAPVGYNASTCGYCGEKEGQKRSSAHSSCSFGVWVGRAADTGHASHARVLPGACGSWLAPLGLVPVQAGQCAYVLSSTYDPVRGFSDAACVPTSSGRPKRSGAW